MQCELLISNFKNPGTVASVKENIRHIPGGSLPHCAGALNLVFKKAFELKKKNKKPPGVLLRCPNPNCPCNTKHVSYLSVGPKRSVRQKHNYCEWCGYNYYKQCAGCGYNRTGDFSSCQSCGKAFA